LNLLGMIFLLLAKILAAPDLPARFSQLRTSLLRFLPQIAPQLKVLIKPARSPDGHGGRLLRCARTTVQQQRPELRQCHQMSGSRIALMAFENHIQL
jgi:hypothetical protein